ncbi:MAG: PilT/PilU family type 4a pilus ATPase [Armatimonadetes bacterium]|nr:PilT/PilU family type 4a pilus ATPase [Armatimonadota bacterium]
MDLQALFAEADRRNVSDIYLKVGVPAMIRAEGETLPYDDHVLTPEDTRQVAHLIMGEGSKRRDFEANPEMNLAYSVPGVGRFRVNFYVQRGSTAMVMRRVKSEVPTIEGMGLPPMLGTLAMDERGLILVTGATGSGKSTTLAAMIHHRNLHATGHILTIEDPVEFLHTDAKSIVSQREIGTDTESFEQALKNALRQAPDVILIGEMRDRESVKAALDFAETGHLVLSTLHSTNANQTVERILQFFPADQHQQVLQLLASNLKGIISQRLLRRSDGKGRVAAIEMMITTQRIRELLYNNDLVKLKSTIEQGVNEGMQTFDQHIYQLHKVDNLITVEEAMANADSPNDLRLRIRGLSSGGLSIS